MRPGAADGVRESLSFHAEFVVDVVLAPLVEGLTVLHATDDLSAIGAVDLRRSVLDVVARRGAPEDLEVDVPPVRVLADADVLVRIVDALVANALRHGAPPFLVRADARGDTVRLVVQDAGPGFPDGTWETMFQPFTQGPIDDEHQPGVGIGLATVARRVASLGGRVWAEPSPDGAGASIHVELPAATARPVEPSPPASAVSPD